MLMAYVLSLLCGVADNTGPPSLLNEPVLPDALESPSGEQAGNPGQQQSDRSGSKKMIEREQEVTIIAGGLSEENPVGPYKQPEWTQHRRFAATRIYLQQPPGGVEFEQWLEVRIPKQSGKANETRLRQEFEFGLGDGLQLDLYALQVYKQRTTSQGTSENTFEWRGWSAEVRWAPWNWGEVFGNPTLYFEYLLLNGDSDTIEPKLLFGGEIASGWYWGVNLVYEAELVKKEDRTEEYKITFGLSHTLKDKKLSLGISAEAAYEVERDNGDADRSRQVYVGPTLQYRPIPKAHINIEPLWGVTGESKRMKLFLVFGWDF